MDNTQNTPNIRTDSRAARARRMQPHGFPMFIAICRAEGGGRRYHQCHTRDQALGHHPYIIEHVNGWGQVTRRERLA